MRSVPATPDSNAAEHSAPNKRQSRSPHNPMPEQSITDYQPDHQPGQYPALKLPGTDKDKMDTITTETQPKIYKKTQAAMAMMAQGMDAKTAVQIVNNTDKPASSTIRSLKAKYRKYSLTAPGTVKAASSQIKRILAGEVREIDQQKVTKDGQIVDYTEKIAPSDTNILAAASLVYDRYEPVIKQSATINIDISAINLDDYRNKLACGLQGEIGQNSQVIEMIKDK